jgi:hypothetical protein
MSKFKCIFIFQLAEILCGIWVIVINVPFMCFSSNGWKGRDFLYSLCMWPVIHHMELSNWSDSNLSLIARQRLQASIHWISNSPFLGVPWDRTMQSLFTPKDPDSGAYQNDLLLLDLKWIHRIECFPSGSMQSTLQVCLDSIFFVRRAVLVVVPESRFFHFSPWHVLHTEVFFLFQCVICAYCADLYIPVYFPWNYNAYFLSWFLLVKSVLWPCEFHMLKLSFSPSLLICNFLFCIRSCDYRIFNAFPPSPILKGHCSPPFQLNVSEELMMASATSSHLHNYWWLS